MKNSSLENVVNTEVEEQKLPKKPGQIKKILKKIGLGTAALATAAAITGGVWLNDFLFRKEGQIIKGNLDGKINTEYYQDLLLNNTTITNMAQVEDLVAEVYHLNTGRKIEDDFRFTVYDHGTEVKRMQQTLWLHGETNPPAMIWANGDIYLKTNDFRNFLNNVFHEIGHGKADSNAAIIKGWGRLFSGERFNTEPKAEENVINSMLSMAYLNPEIGYEFFSEYLQGIYFSFLADDSKDKWENARFLNLINCSERGRLRIIDAYPEEYPLWRIVKSKKENLIEDFSEYKTKSPFEEIKKGFLDMFEQKFQDMPDFQQKYALIRDYLKYGNLKDKYPVITKKDRDKYPDGNGGFNETKALKDHINMIRREIQEKEDFIKQKQYSPFVELELRESLLSSYEEYSNASDDDITKDRTYELRRTIIQDKSENLGAYNKPPELDSLCNQVSSHLECAINREDVTEIKWLDRIVFESIVPSIKSPSCSSEYMRQSMIKTRERFINESYKKN